MDSAAFRQLIMLQQWTERRPPQQWQLQNYVCHVLEKKIVSGQNLNAKKKKEAGSAVLGLSVSFYELNWRAPAQAAGAHSSIRRSLTAGQTNRHLAAGQTDLWPQVIQTFDRWSIGQAVAISIRQAVAVLTSLRGSEAQEPTQLQTAVARCHSATVAAGCC